MREISLFILTPSGKNSFGRLFISISFKNFSSRSVRRAASVFIGSSSILDINSA